MAKKRRTSRGSGGKSASPDPSATGSVTKSALPESDPTQKPFTPEVLDKTVIAVPLLEILKLEKKQLQEDPNRKPAVHSVIIDLNLEYPKGRDEARKVVEQMIADTITEVGPLHGDEEGISEAKSRLNQQYVFAELRGEVIEALAKLDQAAAREATKAAGVAVAARGGLAQVAPGRAIYHIWPDFDVHPLISLSISTVKADAARNAFSAFGEGIVWAVMDSGIDGGHPHFVKHKNLELGSEADALRHRDFTVLKDEKPLEDRYGHGTHVAGIIAGEMTEQDGTIEADIRYRDESGDPKDEHVIIRPSISGMAPKCKLVSLKILNDRGQDVQKDPPKGKVSNILAAIDYVQQVNGYGRRIRIHGVNLSVGYDFEPRWFACGQSPLCVEVDRLVKSGVVVVVASGNTGYSATFVEGKGMIPSGKDLSINDPGNADLAITVGSTHRDMPHVYGVSYFSSKGPTGDGRLKPDLVAPGEKIISADSTQRRRAFNLNLGLPEQASPSPADDPADAGPATPQPQPPGNPAPSGNNKLHAKYREDTGTSMAAPHVSGVIAAFLSVRREFIGRAEQLKEIFCSAATDLGRERYFQGKGLVDLMRAIQSV
jgi:serine protease AprX